MFIFTCYFDETGQPELPDDVIRNHVKAYIIGGNGRNGYVVTDKDLSYLTKLKAIKKYGEIGHFEILFYFACLHDELLNDTERHGAAIQSAKGGRFDGEMEQES